MEHLSYQERLAELGLSIPEQIKLRGISSTYIYLRGSTERTEPDSSQWCPVAGPDITGTKQNAVGSLCMSETFSLQR